MKPSGYPLPDGQMSDQSNPLRSGTQMPSSLGFLTSRQILSARKEHHLSRHDRWDKGQQYQRDVRWQSIAARNRKQADLSLGLWSAIALIIFSGFSLASVALNNEKLLMMLQPQVEKLK